MRHARSIELDAAAPHNAAAPLASAERATAPRHPAAATHVEIWTDGACRGNPGPGGWGAWLRSGAHDKEICGGAAATTNNRMELTAVIEALRSLKRPCQVVLHTDSRYVQGGITEWMPNWIRRGWLTADRKPVKNEDLWRALGAQAARHQVEWRWVKGHAGIDGNERADRLANQGLEEALRAGPAADV